MFSVLIKIKQSIFLSLLFVFISSSLLSILLATLNPIDMGGYHSDNKFIEILTAIVIAPILETFLFFWIPYNVIEYNGDFKYKRGVFIVLSGLFFGLNHLYSVNYFIETWYSGCFMADYYYFNKNKKPFIKVTLLHALYNLLVMGLNFILD